jgi:uncharacterized protein (TIGR00290 family)
MSWSSGKDSAWALHLLNREHPGAVAAAMTVINEAADRVTMHAVRRTVVEAQAAVAGLPLRGVPIPDPCPQDVYDAKMIETVTDAVREGFTHIAFGDLFLDDVRRYREERLAGSGLEPLFPAWGASTSRLAESMIDAGLRAKLVCVDTRVLDEAFVGCEFDRDFLRALPRGVDPCGENGEFHTCVYAGPMFIRPLTLQPGKRVSDGPFVWRDLSA